MRVAIVGIGVIGRVHAEIVPNYGTLCALCDVNAETMAPYPHVPHYTDYEEMLRIEKPDVVHICTPHYLHADMVITALQQDIHVLCEKPLCIREEDIGRILEAEAHSRAQLGVCMQNRYNGANLYVKERLEWKTVKAATGQVSWHRGVNYYRSAPWRGRWDTEGGGVLINQALHTLDLLQWFLGMPEQICAGIANLTLQDQIEVEDTATVIGSGDAPGFVLHATVGACGDVPVEIQIKTADTLYRIYPNAVLENDRLLSFPFTLLPGAKECYGRSHEPLIADFYDCVQTGRPFAIDGAEAAKVVRLILAAYQSHGMPVKIK